LIAPTQSADLMRRIAAAPERDEIEVLSEAARLTLDQVVRLRRKVIAQRAARTFSVESGEFVIDSNVEIPILTGLAIDVRSVIYLGARINLSERRLAEELRQLGGRFALKPEAADELRSFGFTDAEQPILDALRAGISLAELEARYRDLDPRIARAVIYSLVSCSLCTASAAAPPTAYSQARTGRDVFVPRGPTVGSSPPGARAVTASPEPAPRPPAWRAPSSGPDETGVPRSAGAPRAQPPAIPRTRTPLRTSTSTAPGGAARSDAARSDATPLADGSQTIRRAPSPS